MELLSMMNLLQLHYPSQLIANIHAMVWRCDSSTNLELLFLSR